MTTLTILIPTLNEEKALPATLLAVSRLSPPPDEILIIDGGSTDATMAIATASSGHAATSPRKGRAAQINFGVAIAKGDIVCVLHADSVLPTHAIALIQQTMANPYVALGSFMPRLVGETGTRWGSTVHNFLKTWYIPMLFRPLLFWRGVRLLYGDHAMFFRAAQFLAVGGCDERVAVMEEADLCIKLAGFGRTKMLHHWVQTSDRRIAAWGRWRANWIYFKVGVLWAMGARERLADHYPDVR